MDYFKMTSPCGLDCFNCPLFLAGNDMELRESLAKKLSVTIDTATCAGCRNQCGTVEAIGRSKPCRIYQCAQNQDIDFCFQCSDFPCDHLHPVAYQADQRPHNTKVFNSCLIKKMGLENWAVEKALAVKETYFQGRINLDD